MKTKYYILLATSLCIFLPRQSAAQPSRFAIDWCKYSITAGIGISEYAGDLGNGFFRFDLQNHTILPANGNAGGTYSPGIGFIALNRFVNDRHDWSLRIYNGQWGYYQSAASINNNFFHDVTAIEFTPRWKFMNKGPDVRFIPYLCYGVGVRRVQMSTEAPGVAGIDKKSIYEINVPAGIGCNFRLTHYISLNAQSNLAWTSEKHNAIQTGTTYNWLWNHSIGLTFAFCRLHDTKCKKF